MNLFVPSQVFYTNEIARFIGVMVLADPAFLEPCRVLRVLFHCMEGDRERSFILPDIENRLMALQTQRPDYLEAINAFRGYLGLAKDYHYNYGHGEITKFR